MANPTATRPHWRLTGHPKAITRPAVEALIVRRLAQARGASGRQSPRAGRLTMVSYCIGVLAVMDGRNADPTGGDRAR
jgi:hypothetical protein